MSKSKIYRVIGIMSGTSMDGIDFSLMDTDGMNYVKIISEKTYLYEENYRNKLKKIIKNFPKTKYKQFIYIKKNEDLITSNFLKFTRRFIKYYKINTNKINLIGLSGQTIFHNPKKRYSLQLGSGKELNKKLKIPVIANFRKNDLLNGGQGAPIGSFYHKNILNKINKKACIINLGGIANITFYNKKKLISYDMGPSNSLIDDLCNYFYKEKFDKDGLIGTKGKLIKKIFDRFKLDVYFNKPYPKSLDREHFHLFYKDLIKYNANNAIHTASMMTVYGIIKGIILLNQKFDLMILTGGGRKNNFIKKNLKKKLSLSKIKILDIDKFGFNGDMIEAQMFGYIGVRSIKKLPLSLPETTGVSKPISGGIKYGKIN